MAFSMGMDWNNGEEKMHNLLHVPPQDNPTASMLSPQASYMLQQAPLLAIGTVDSQSRPWTTLWGGSKGFSEPLGGGFVGTRTLVDNKYDPVVQALVGGAKDGEMLQPENGKLIAGLAIDLMTRKRVKIAGKMVAGTVWEVEVESEAGLDMTGAPEQHQIQLVTKIDQSLGNCPKYLNQYEMKPAAVNAKVLSEETYLSDEGKGLIQNADMFFLSTGTLIDQDTNHRGGPPGFVRIISPTEIVYPEYSGNRLYQSLGNLLLNPKIGITFPNYITGDVLYITGTTEVLIEKDAANVLPGSNLAVKVTIDEARFVQSGLPFRGTRMVPSPYNPRVRPLAAEGNIKASLSASSKPQTAQLIKKEILTPTIARFRFSVSDGIIYQPGQWMALDFKAELDTGYEHMRNDDPTSLNDDFVRTFTISSIPKSDNGKEKEFEMTMRRNGPVTGLLFKQNDRAGFEVPILGVGGDFKISQDDKSNGIVPFIAGGVGITPLLGQLDNLNLSSDRFKLLWTLRLSDIDLAVDILQQRPELAVSTHIYFTGAGSEMEDKLNTLQRLGTQVEKRRMKKDDLDAVDSDTWYLCAGKPLRQEVLRWLDGKNAVYEDFDY